MANIPKPITRKDMYYSYLISGTGELPRPITKQDQYLYYLCVNGFGSGGAVTPEMIDEAVSKYLDANPVQSGVTEEQAKQIDDNTAAIGELQTDVKEVFQSVSSGKEVIASAITDKGVETDAKATFATMAQNIIDIPAEDAHDVYEGDYNLVPKVLAQSVETKDKLMKDNVTVAEIPFHEVSNETGKTAIIGGIL